MNPMTARSIAALAAVSLLLAGCASVPGEVDEDSPPAPAATTPPSNENTAATVEPTGVATTLATGLTTPWSIVPLPTGSTLLSERDTGRVVERTADGDLRTVGVVDGVVPSGEGGLLGLAALDLGTPYLFTYFTAAGDNRIVRYELIGAPGSYQLGAREVLLAGIPKARTHNGGRLTIGPDGMLYATTGDAQQVTLAQDVGSLAGKILRLTPHGDVPADNPFPGSYVYSLGHRNPQGIVFDRTGQLWASEFGQNTWDELNRIDAGANYGWPVVEGVGGREGFVDPVQQWATSEASPSGLGIVGDTLFMASLRGQRLWIIDVNSPDVATDAFTGAWGRLRDAVAAPDGTLFVITSNTDGRATPAPDDDRLITVQLAPRG